MTIITASEIQKGDLIRVTLPETSSEDRKRKITYEGVAHTTDGLYKGKRVWRTEKAWGLYTHTEGVTIELLDRPEPKLTVPTLPGAVVKYKFTLDGKPRTAIRNKKGRWQCYDDKGGWRNARDSDVAFEALLKSEDPNFEVVFAGVAQ